MALFKDRSTDELKTQRDERVTLTRTLTGRRADDNRRAIREITQELSRRGVRDR